MVITIVFSGEELAAFQKLLGAIGGTSQAVNCLPEDLKKVDLWTVPEGDLKTVHGIIETPNVARDVDVNSDISTDIDEKISCESSDEFETRKSDDANLKKDGNPPENACLCNLYEVQPNDVEVIVGPSLFALSSKEDHWRDVLPVVVNERRIPLNIPVALLDSAKLVRVKNLNQDQGNETKEQNQNICCDPVIQFGTESKDGSFLSYREIDNFFNNPVLLSNNKKQFPSQNIDMLKHTHGTEDSSKSQNNNAAYEKSLQILSMHDDEINRTKQLLMGFDSFDIVGWMAVDESHNILDQIKAGNFKISEFALVNCQTGKNHIKVVSPFSSDVRQDIDLEDHISTLNLEQLKLIPPYSLADIEKQLSSCKMVKPFVESLNCQSIANGKGQVAYKEKNNVNSVKSNNSLKKIGPKPKHNNGEANQDKPSHCDKNNTNKNQMQSFDHKQNITNSIDQNISHNQNVTQSNKRNLKKHQSRSSKERSSSMKNNGQKIMNHTNENMKADNNQEANGSVPVKSFNNKINANNSKKSNKLHESNINPFIYNTNSMLYDRSVTKSNPKISTESRSESDSTSEISEKSYLSMNGHHRSSVSEESGPYVDMAQNLAKLQELSDFDEYNSGSSSESDVLGAVGPRSIRKIHSVCKKGTKTDGQKDFHLKKEPTCYDHQRKFCKVSSESLESESGSNWSNHRSFRTAHSQNSYCEDLRSYEKHASSQSKRDMYDNIDIPHEITTNSYQKSNFSMKPRYKDVTGKSSFNERRDRMLEDNCKKQHKSLRRNSVSNNYSFQGAHQYDHFQNGYGHSKQKAQMLSSSNLCYDWYTTWYTEVRQKAKELEYKEYINTMSSS